MSYETQRAYVSMWLDSVGMWGKAGEKFRYTEHEDGRGTVIFCTGTHSYQIAFSDTYLGCVASCRTQRPGETWTRGNDLPDGGFSRETFDRIIFAIVGYELVALAPVPEHKTVEVAGC